MKKKKSISLRLKKLSISNLQNLPFVEGGGSVRLCSEGDCGETPNCETQGGYMCGRTIAANCATETCIDCEVTIRIDCGYNTLELPYCDGYTNGLYC